MLYKSGCKLWKQVKLRYEAGDFWGIQSLQAWQAATTVRSVKPEILWANLPFAQRHRIIGKVCFLMSKDFENHTRSSYDSSKLVGISIMD